MARSRESVHRMVHGRMWTVYGATGDSKRPLRPIACVRANAKSIAGGIIHRDPRYNHIPRKHLVVVEGCWKK